MAQGGLDEARLLGQLISVKRFSIRQLLKVELQLVFVMGDFLESRTNRRRIKKKKKKQSPLV